MVELVFSVSMTGFVLRGVGRGRVGGGGGVDGRGGGGGGGQVWLVKQH